jgi:SAM-dependent methyltransferase
LDGREFLTPCPDEYTMPKPFGNWFHSFDEPGLQIEGRHPVSYQLKKAEIIPDDLSGKSVVDLGAGQGFYCRLAEKRGAERVVGVNYDPTVEPQFEHVRQQTGSEVEWRVENLFDISEEFDVVICTGVLYHVPDPNELLDHLFALSNETICLSSIVFPSPLKKAWRYDSRNRKTIGSRDRIWPRIYARISGLNLDESVPTSFWIDDEIQKRGGDVELRHPFVTPTVSKIASDRLPLDRLMPFGLRYGVRASVDD